MTPEDGLSRNHQPKYPINLDDLKQQDDGLNPARGCLLGGALALLIYGVAATVVVVWLALR